MRITLATGTDAELVAPDMPPGSDRPLRGVVLIPDIFGLRPLMDTHVELLSHATGWPVCAFEPWPGREDLTLDERLGAMASLDDSVVLADAAAAADATGAEQVSVLGFCMGGMYALKASTTGRFAQAVSFYGMIRIPDAWQGPGQADPLALGAGGAAPVLAIIGGCDPWTPPQDVADLRAAGAEVVVYPQADHGFVHDPERPAHRADDAADAWRRVMDFLVQPV